MVYGWGSQQFSIYQSFFDLRGTGRLRMIMTYIPSDDTWHKNKWFRGGNLNCFWDIRTISVSRGRNHPILSWPIHHQMFLDTENKNMYGLGVGIATVFQIFGHFLIKGRRDHPVWLWPKYYADMGRITFKSNVLHNCNLRIWHYHYHYHYSIFLIPRVWYEFWICFGTFYSNSSKLPLLRNKAYFSSSPESSGCRNIVHPLIPCDVHWHH
jgi:hypothetical protein